MADELPLVDVRPLVDGSPVEGVAAELDDACRRFGFVRLTGHGADPRPLLAMAAEFFAEPDAAKQRIAILPGSQLGCHTRCRAGSATGARCGHAVRWDGADPLGWHGRYGDYLTAKVAKVFPALMA